MKIDYRNPTEADAGAVAKVMSLSNRELKHHTEISEEEVRTWIFGEKDFDPKGFLLVFADGQPVAYGGSMISKSRLENGFRDAQIGLSVIPEMRRKGIEEHLTKSAMAFLRGKNMGAAKIWAPEKISWLNEFAVKIGMKDVRHGYMMIYDRKEPPQRTMMSEGYAPRKLLLKDFTDEDIGAFVTAFNESFMDHYNFSPTPLERFYKIRDEEKKKGDTITGFTMAMKGKEIAGVCMYNIDLEYNKQNNKKVGWTQILGVRKPHRRFGLGRALLSDSMIWLREQGMDTLFLGMDAENSKALGLYTSQGYRVDEESVSYELKL